MEGYELISAVDDKSYGKVVGEENEYVIVEHGTLRKTRHAVPRTSIEVDDEQRQVRTTLSRELIDDSPKVEDGGIDEVAVARHYGLAAGSEAPPTEGYGQTTPDDPARGAEYDQERADIETAVEQRARIREGGTGASGMPDESPAMLGDRLADVPDEDSRR
jgi:hypothetical protein